MITFGTERVHRVFLFLPRHIGGQTKWLQVAYIVQQWGIYCGKLCWRDKRWASRLDYDGYVRFMTRT
jgi:hypothetical protein